jgi:hypothetical protein
MIAAGDEMKSSRAARDDRPARRSRSGERASI